MKYYSTKKQSPLVDLREAVLRGLAPDGGLYMPKEIPVLDKGFFQRINILTMTEIAMSIAEAYFGSDIQKRELQSLTERAIAFDAPLVKLNSHLYVLELFHGPTLSFKDFGISFMAQLTGHLIRHDDQELNILAATSGDTGGAVGQGFLKMPGVKVWILYPKGQITHIQEMQITTLGHNVTAVEVEGTFDDCQALVKRAFNDPLLTTARRLTSANSINIARLIPQTFYYFYAYAQLSHIGHEAVFSIPSGNFGNLTAGLFAKRMGLPVKHMIASTNVNEAVPVYLRTGTYTPRPSIRTISNAMDVGDPSNFARMLNLYGYDVDRMRRDVVGKSYSDRETEEGIKELYEKYSYIADPHGAIGYLGLKDNLGNENSEDHVFLETAHPVKFLDIVEKVLHRSVDMPEELMKTLAKPKLSVPLANDYGKLKDLLLS